MYAVYVFFTLKQNVYLCMDMVRLSEREILCNCILLLLLPIGWLLLLSVLLVSLLLLLLCLSRFFLFSLDFVVNKLVVLCVEYKIPIRWEFVYPCAAHRVASSVNEIKWATNWSIHGTTPVHDHYDIDWIPIFANHLSIIIIILNDMIVERWVWSSSSSTFFFYYDYLQLQAI